MKIQRQHHGLIAVCAIFAISILISKIPKNSAPTENIKKVYFTDATDLLDKKFIHKDNKLFYTSNLKTVYYRSLFFAPGIAVADFNKDGWQDFIAVSSESGANPQIYINDKGNKFINKNDDWGLNDSRLSDLKDTNISPFVYDYDNDGDLDLLVTNLTCNKYYENKGNKFLYVPEHRLNKECHSSFSYLFYDLNEDSKTDILELHYWYSRWAQNMFDYDGKDSFRGGPNSLFNALNGGRNATLLSGEKRFHTLGYDNRWSFDAVVTDIDSDNKSELFVANDYSSDRIYQHRRDHVFYDVTRGYMFPDRRNGMSIASNYHPNDPYPYIYISNIYIEDYIEKGNFYWHYNEDTKSLEDYAIKSNVNDCRWAWGASIADFNLDGYNDIYIANGYLSSNNQSSKEGNFRMASLSSLPFEDFVKKMPSVTQKSEKRIPFEFGENFSSVSGDQKDCLKLFDPNTNKFVDFSKEGTLDQAWDGRAVATIDYDNDGDLDLLVTNQNNYLRLLKNTIEKNSNNNWIGFEISNHHLIKKITIYQGRNMYYKDWNAGRTGFLATSDSRIHFGLIGSNPVKVIFEFTDARKVTKSAMELGKYHNLGKI